MSREKLERCARIVCKGINLADGMGRMAFETTIKEMLPVGSQIKVVQLVPLDSDSDESLILDCRIILREPQVVSVHHLGGQNSSWMMSSIAIEEGTGMQKLTMVGMMGSGEVVGGAREDGSALVRVQGKFQLYLGDRSDLMAPPKLDEVCWD